MDAPYRLFFSLDRENGQFRFIHSLRSENGQELKHLAYIRRRVVHFYAEPYASEYTVVEEISVFL